MKRVYQRLPVYTGDVSGACSALYELGGMVVIHDPSGCNSTYNTHDEIRWYDRDSLIFLSGLDEMDAVLGSDEKLIREIAEAALSFRPSFIAIVNSPIPYITGQDFDAVCRAVEEETGIPAFYVSTNGMHDYVRGAGLALLRIAERFVSPAAERQLRVREDKQADRTDHGEERSQTQTLVRAGGTDHGEVQSMMQTREREKDRAAEGGRGTDRPSCCLLGVTPLDFAAPSSLESLYETVERAGYTVLSCWAMGREDRPEDLLEQIAGSFRADVNLVLSSAGFPAAVFLREKYGIPFVVGIPAEETEKIYFEAVRRAVRTGEGQFPFRNRRALAPGKGRMIASPEESPSSAGDLRGIRVDRVPSEKKESAPGKMSDGFCESECARAEAAETACFIGEPVLMTSLAARAAMSGRVTHVFGATEGAGAFLGPDDFPLSGEEELMKALEEISENTAEASCKADGRPVCIAADPFYECVVPEGAPFLRLPHLAFSGRIFLGEIPDPVKVLLNFREEERRRGPGLLQRQVHKNSSTAV